MPTEPADAAELGDSPGPPAGRLFGVDLASDHPLASHLDRPVGPAELRFSCSTAPLDEGEAAALAPLFASGRRVDGESLVSLHSRPGLDLLRFARVADYLLEAARIRCHLRAPALDYLVEIRLLGPVLSFWLERQGLPALHASAVVAGGRAVAFLGSNGAGKTTLGASLAAAGFPLLTDDILALEAAGGEILGRPGYPQLRLWPDQAALFLDSWQQLPRVHPGYSKRRVRVGEGGLGAFHPRACPVGRLYLLAPLPAGRGGPVAITPVSGRDGLIELLRHSFSPHLVEAAGLQPRRMERFAELLGRCPLHRLSYPRGFDRLGEVREAIRQDLAAGGIDPSPGPE